MFIVYKYQVQTKETISPTRLRKYIITYQH